MADGRVVTALEAFTCPLEHYHKYNDGKLDLPDWEEEPLYRVSPEDLWERIRAIPDPPDQGPLTVERLNRAREELRKVQEEGIN